MTIRDRCDIIFRLSTRTANTKAKYRQPIIDKRTVKDEPKVTEFKPQVKRRKLLPISGKRKTKAAAKKLKKTFAKPLDKRKKV